MDKEEKPRTIGEYVREKNKDEKFSDDFLWILTLIMSFGNFGNRHRQASPNYSAYTIR